MTGAKSDWFWCAHTYAYGWIRACIPKWKIATATCFGFLVSFARTDQTSFQRLKCFRRGGAIHCTRVLCLQVDMADNKFIMHARLPLYRRVLNPVEVGVNAAETIVGEVEQLMRVQRFVSIQQRLSKRQQFLSLVNVVLFSPLCIQFWCGVCSGDEFRVSSLDSMANGAVIVG